ncbi:hypothetical protein ACYG9R_28435 [Mesorhizobium sp. RSR565B]|uniref:hypothetical protein n=1 Tax=Mesorhizobium sp. L103C565B0 TaxID=1287094 RepID=UPI0003D0086F|nr:hypothetical protein [Mesorhizobium sp. L103C565B0]ESZ41086.1 hypothetical protein X730_29820 [Mesorhizobium sp. L103C565B0]
MKWPLKGPPFSKSSRDGMGKRLAFWATVKGAHVSNVGLHLVSAGLRMVRVETVQVGVSMDAFVAGGHDSVSYKSNPMF